MQKLELTADRAGQASAFLSASGLPASEVKKAFKARDVKVNGVRISADARLLPGDLLEIYYAPAPFPAIAFEDEDMLILCKPQGLEVQGAGGLEGMVRQRYPEALPCHRLDAQTGGLVTFSKHDRAHEYLLEEFYHRRVKKLYQCITVRPPNPPAAYLKAYLFKDEKRAVARVTDRPIPGAMPIATRYETVSAGELALLEVELITGRTHQIRAHLAHIACPIAGDDKYGDRSANKALGIRAQALFAVSITFQSGICASVSPDFPARLLERCGGR